MSENKHIHFQKTLEQIEERGIDFDAPFEEQLLVMYNLIFENAARTEEVADFVRIDECKCKH